MGWFFSSHKEVDRVSEEVTALNHRCNKMGRELDLITGDTGLFMNRDNLKKLRADIDKLSKVVSDTRSEISRMWSIFYEANHHITDIQREIVAHLGLEVVVDPAKPATIKLVKKGKK